MSDGIDAPRPGIFTQDGPDEATCAVLDSLPFMVAFLNLAGDVPYANPAFNGISGRDRVIEGAGWATALHPDDLARAATHRELQLGSEKSIPLEVRFSDGNGGWLTVAVGYYVVRGEEGDVVGWLATAITVDGILRVDS